MVIGLLTAFQIHLAENPLPSHRRQGASTKTIQGYVQDISIFLRWWQGSFGEDLTMDVLRSDPFRLNRKVLQDFLSWLQTTQRYSASAILRYAASLRTFCQYLISTQILYWSAKGWTTWLKTKKVSSQ
jgi:site-specific recombinase XerD